MSSSSSSVGLSNDTTETWFPSSFNSTTSSSHNFSFPSTTTSSPTVLAEIWANDVISRANYVYSVFLALGLMAGCFLFYGFVQTYRIQRSLGWLYRLLAAFCCLQMLVLLLSLHMVANRPKYLQTTALGCAALYFVIDAASLCSLLILVLMAYALTLDPPPNALLRKPLVCTALVVLTSAAVSMLLSGLRNPHTEPRQNTNDCFKDHVPVSYAATRLFLAVLVPYIFQFGLLTCGLVRQWKTKGRFLSGSEEGPVYLTVSLLILFCQLFYSVVLVSIDQQEVVTPGKEVLVNVAEFVLYLGSSCSLLLVLFVHRPFRESLHTLLRQLQDCCQNPGRSQPNRNIIAPHIEITDTLQDIES